MLENPNIPYQKVSNSLLERKHVQLIVKRLDLIHPLVSGNKFYKLKYNIEAAKRNGYRKLVTFGGAFSNHIHAAAEAAKLEGLKIVGIIRGEESLPLNPTLQRATDSGMELHYISRTAYRDKTDPGFIDRLKDIYGDFYLIPEGGTNALAIKGTSEIIQGEDFSADIITCSIGTGGTMGGIVSAAKEDQKVWGFSSLKGDFIYEEFNNLLIKESIRPKCSYEIFSEYHFGGYGKHKAELLDFMHDFYRNTGIPLDPVYTGKMMYGIFNKLEEVEDHTTILCLHTGGLQGIAGFNRRFGTELPER